MITVMFLETSLQIGGAETMWAQIIERLDRRRFRAILCCLYDPGPLGERLQRAGIPVYSRVAANRWDLRVVWRLVRLLRQERVNVLYMIDQPLTQFWGTVCGRCARVGVLMSMVQSTGEINRIRRRLWIHRLTFPFVDRITAVGEMHQAYLCEQEGLDPSKIAIIPNGVDPGRFASEGDGRQLREHLGIADGEPTVGIVALLRPEKAHEVFLEAAARVLQQVPTTRFLVVGDGSRRARLEEMAQRLGLTGRILFLGVREDVPTIVKLLDVGVLCSHPVVETLPLSVLEYMAAGKPVVATRVGSLPELVEEGQTGFLVNPGDSEALASRIVRLLTDRGVAERMGRAGRQRVVEHYAIEQVVRRTEALFSRLFEHRTNGKKAQGF